MIPLPAFHLSAQPNPRSPQLPPLLLFYSLVKPPFTFFLPPSWPLCLPPPIDHPPPSLHASPLSLPLFPPQSPRADLESHAPPP